MRDVRALAADVEALPDAQDRHQAVARSAASTLALTTLVGLGVVLAPLGVPDDDVVQPSLASIGPLMSPV